ncbi:ATPase AAA [Streptomyces purpurascens]
MEPTEATLPLFDEEPARPLADRLRPTQLEDVVGQDHLLAPGRPTGSHGRVAAPRLRHPVGPARRGENDHRPPPRGRQQPGLRTGVGHLLRRGRPAQGLRRRARSRRTIGQGTLLFVDEIHRFNRAQQDSFLPYVEDGTISLIGATTENPSFELNGALLSRAQVLVLKRLDEAALSTLLDRAEDLTGHRLPLDDDARRALIAMADGDGRYLLNMAEQLQALPDPGIPLDTAALAHHIQQRAPLYDKAQEGHYNLISALHKSMRSSNPDAALYWLARMLDGGEDPLFVARRLVRFANEDIEPSPTRATPMSSRPSPPGTCTSDSAPPRASWRSPKRSSTSPRPPSPSPSTATNAAHRSARRTGSLMPPAHILNAPTRLMKDLGYGKDYQYDPDTTDGFSGADYFPDGMDHETYYQPTRNGYEPQITERLRHWAVLRARLQRG